MTYISSIINNYNDPANIKKDGETLREIYKRQGQYVFLETISSEIGNQCLNKPPLESIQVMKNTVGELKEMILERI